MVRLKQLATYAGVDGLHQWRCRLELDCPPDELERIAQVVYTLDRSYAQPVHVMTNRTEHFALVFESWASFELHAAVEYLDGSREMIAAELALALPAGVGDDVPLEAGDVPFPRFEPPVVSLHEADLILDGGGLRSIAFAGALEAAEEFGITSWVSVAASSAGAIPATLLVAGYPPRDISRLLAELDYRHVFKWRVGGPTRRVLATWRNRGVIGTDHLRAWLEEVLAASPLGLAQPTFGDLIGLGAKGAPRHPLRLIVSDVTAARMTVLPDDLDRYTDASGKPLVAEAFPVIDAVITSMLVPFMFAPTVIHSEGAPHHVLDGGLLSNFPVWLFDSSFPQRPTWGMRLRTRRDESAAPPPLPTGMLGMFRALATAVLEAARESEPIRNEARTLTVPVPAGNVGPHFDDDQLAQLRGAGLAAGREFFATRGTYLNSLGRGLPEATLVASAKS